MKKVILAYSGGLDTSCIIPWLKDRGYDPIAFVADVGQKEDFNKLKKRAKASGASKVYCLNLQKEFVDDYIFPALKAGALYEEKYNLACALSRPLIAKHLVAIAHKENAPAIAHGCTGKGNDQVRFEVTARLIDSKLEILAPVRTWEFKTRDEEIDYAKSKNVPVNVTKKSPYSIDVNLYGRAIECGVLENPDQEPPEEIYSLTTSPEKSPMKPDYVEIGFSNGVPVKLNGKKLAALSMIAELNKIAGRHGIGRVDMIENRLVGIKSREVYENPAGAVFNLALKELESLVLDRESIRFKYVVAQKYAGLVYNGLWETPLRYQLDAYLEKLHERSTGSIRLKLYKGACSIAGRKSKYSRYKEAMATYGEGDVFDQRLAEGFIRLWGMPYET